MSATVGSSQPASAAAVIAMRLEEISILVPTPGKSAAELLTVAGSTLALAAAGIVATLGRDRKGPKARRREMAVEAMELAQMADLCMARAAQLASGGGAT